MQKWHVQSALGRARPAAYSSQIILVRQFNVHAKPAKEDDLPSRRDRQSDFTDQLHQHFQRHDSRKNIRPRALDARDFAPVPNRTPKPPGKSISDRIPASRAPLDTQSLGAQRSSNGPQITRTSARQLDGRSSNGPRIIRTSDGQPEDRGPRMLPRQDASDKQFQGGVSNAQHNRNRAPRTQSRASRSRAEGSREHRDAVRSNGNDDRDGSRDSKEELSSMEIKYLESRDNTSDYNDSIFEGRAARHTRSNQSKIYTPTEITLESLQGMGPALACGEWGMSETVGEKMIQVNKAQTEYDERINELAQKWAEGVFCHFRSKQERDHTTKTVERNLAGVGDNAKLGEEKDKEKMGLMDTRMEEETRKLATRLLKGDYYIGPLGKGPTAEFLERYTSKNETYLPKDRQSLAGKVNTLLPLKAAASISSPVGK
ncbi:MAG: hypothetical protein LQ343_006402 [Gyalolechia ehrenbergii]|nr:MAG: hypothetical protein LQ343_006402 [Gyalolechia ehrenbergii]